MKIGRGSRRSIRYSVFIGVLAGSVFSGSGAFAAFEILNQGDLEAIGNDPTTRAGDYILMSDITLSPPTSGAPTYIAGAFTGTLDGNGKILSGLTRPLFEEIGAAANTFDEEGELVDTVEIKDLILVTDETLLDADGREIGVSGGGSLANTVSLGGTVNNVSSSGNVTGILGENHMDLHTFIITYSGNTYVGGLVGENNGTISDSDASGDVVGTDAWIGATGGLVGQAMGDISTSSFTGSVTGERYVGGLVGGTGANTISNSSASGAVTGIDGGEGNIGGLVGGGSSQITNSHTDVIVTGRDGNINIGGLLGYGDASVVIRNSYSSGTVTGDKNVGGLVGAIAGGLISESYSNANVNSGTRIYGEDGPDPGEDLDCVAYCYADNFGGLVGWSGKQVGWSGVIRGIYGSSATMAAVIEFSYATGNVTVTGDLGGDGTGVGGLVGYSEGEILNSYATGDVHAGTRAGGLVGQLGAYSLNSGLQISNPDPTDTENPFLSFRNENGLIKNSYATGKINEGNNSANRLGGLVGVSTGGKIINSAATAGGIGIAGGCDHIGGLIGEASSGTVIEDSYAHIDGDLIGGCGLVGGLAGSFSGSGSRINNSYAVINGNICSYLDETGCYPTGTYIGGLIGYAPNPVTITSSFANVTGEIYGGSFFGSLIGYYDETLNYDSDGNLIQDGISLNQSEIPNPFPVIPSIFTTVSTNTTPSVFMIDECLNSGNPYLVPLIGHYENTCPTDPPFNPPIRERVEREVREVAETRTSEKIEKTIGFKYENPLPKSALIAFVEATEKIDLAKVKAVEIAPTANVKVAAKAGEALQISLKSESKEPVELWVKSPDGTWLLAGVITFDKDGKAILPPLQFKNAGDYTLVLNKPSANSAKGSAPLNQSGSVLVAVS